MLIELCIYHISWLYELYNQIKIFFITTTIFNTLVPFINYYPGVFTPIVPPPHPLKTALQWVYLLLLVLY